MSDSDLILPGLPGNEDNGNHQWAIGPEDGHIIVRFKHEILWAKLSPDNAMQIANHMLNLAFQIKYGANAPANRIATPGQDKFTHVTDARRALLIINLMSIIRSEAFQRKPLQWQSAHLVDVCMNALV